MKKTWQIVKIKNLLRNKRKWKSYKKEIRDKNMRFLFTKIALNFDLNFSNETLLENELFFLNNVDENFFTPLFIKILSKENLSASKIKKIAEKISFFFFLRMQLSIKKEDFDLEDKSRYILNEVFNDLMELTPNFNFYIIKILEVVIN